VFPVIVNQTSLSLSLSLSLSRVAVIRGRVALHDGSPLVGVNITFPQHPEYGHTVSRQDGRYTQPHTVHTKKDTHTHKKCFFKKK